MKLAAQLSIGMILLFKATSCLAVLEITEIYPGMFGSDGSADWFEVTNLGLRDASTEGLFYTNTGDPTLGYPLPGLELRPGEAAVFLVEQEAEQGDFYLNSVDELYGRWGTGFQAAALNGAPRLSNGGDNVWLFEGASPSSVLVDSKPVNGAFANSQKTIEFFDSSVGYESQLGVNAAFASQPFFSGAELRQLTGSPGRSVRDPIGARLEITEAYAGVFGADGTQDWFEITNVGGRPASTAGVYYVSSDDVNNRAALPALTLQPQESVVFLTETTPELTGDFADSLAEFESIWGNNYRVEMLSSAGRIIANGLSLSLLDGAGPDARVLDSVEVPDELTNDFREEVYSTIWFETNGNASASSLSDGLSRRSNEYENTACFGDCPSPNPFHSIAGSPGEAEVPPYLPGDLNGDDSVDAADYTFWRDAFGSGSVVSGDADFSGRIDGRDLATWRANFGRTRPTGTLDAPFATPEPASALSLVSAIALLASRTRREGLSA